MSPAHHEVDAFFAEGGPLSEGIDVYTPRPEQVSMAQAVERAIRERRSLAVEAGTGVGKSFAYLVPALLLGVPDRKRIVVSTYTISLQDQLIEKDLPALDGLTPSPFVAHVAKGRGNYLSPRRLDVAMGNLFSSSDTSELMSELRRLDEWSQETREGVRQEVQPVPSLDAWEQVQSEHGNCLGSACSYYEGGCFYHDARRRLESADIIVVNHSLLVSDLLLRNKGFGLIPAYDVVILDEAHKFVDVAVEHFGERMSRRMLQLHLNRLSNPKNSKGILNRMKGTERALRLCQSAKRESEQFFDRVVNYAGGEHQTRLLGDGAGFENTLSMALNDLGVEVEGLRAGERSLEETMELTSIGKRTQDLASTISWILQANDENYVYWAEVGRNNGQVEINARPLDVSEQLRDSLFEAAETVVATSATLSVGGQTGLAPFMRDVGMEEGVSLSLGSPFDYSRNVTLRVPTWLEEPNNSEEYAESVADATLDYIKRSDGGVFVLCTSYAFMNKIHDRIVERLERLRFPTFLQGGSLPRGAMIEEFKRDRRSVLFGTASFWEGVDVPGDALRMVIITRLPFPVPTSPLFAARARQMREKGENDFAGLSLPEAIIRFKQGFGRLIRTESDQGTVVVMDTRIVTKSYGRRFLNSLPDCRVIQD